MSWVEEDLKSSSAVVEGAMDEVRDWKLEWQGHQKWEDNHKDDCCVDQPGDSKASDPVAPDDEDEPKNVNHFYQKSPIIKSRKDPTHIRPNQT